MYKYLVHIVQHVFCYLCVFNGLIYMYMPDYVCV